MFAYERAFLPHKKNIKKMTVRKLLFIPSNISVTGSIPTAFSVWNIFILTGEAFLRKINLIDNCAYGLYMLNL
jgi:hypothetical protein